MEYYSTENLHFAAYLRSNGVDLREVVWSPGQEGRKCAFVLRIEKTDPKLIRLISQWEGSEEAREIKRILHQTNLLRGDLITFMNSEKNGN